MSKTEEGLKEAFAGESQANRKYLAFAEKADKEGFPQIAKVFRAAAAAETVHAHAHLRAVGGVKSTEENLKEAVEGEAHEFKSMYPPFLEEAKKEGNKKAEFSFQYALAVEEIHHELYEKVVENGFFHTGDLGYVTKDNIFYYTGRKKDLIIKGGVNISPDEIDEILFKIDEVQEALTVGIPDEYLGEKIISYIVLKDHKMLNKPDVIAFCKKYLSKDKVPDTIEFVDSLPKGHSGKLLRREMKGDPNKT